MWRAYRLVHGFALLCLASCVSHPPDSSLYGELGAEAGLGAIVDAFLVELAEDDRVVGSFEQTDIGEFRRLLIEQLCELSGGPCVYSGRSMVEAHSDMAVSNTQFNALVEDLMAAMDRAEVPQGVQNRLLKLLAPLYGEIVES